MDEASDTFGGGGLFPPGMGRVFAVMLAFVALASIGLLAKNQRDRDFHDRSSLRDKAADACRRIQRDDVALDDVRAARQAFEDDKQLAVGVMARQVESVMEQRKSPDGLDQLRTACRQEYALH